MKRSLMVLALLASFPSAANPVKQALQGAMEKHEPAPSPTMTQEQQYGLAFIFSSKCPYCHQFAPTLQTFAKQTGLPVYAFSVDGLGLPQYPRPLTATKDIVETFYHSTSNVTYPALFLVNLNNRKHVTLGLGNVPLSALNTTYAASLTYPHIKSQLQ
ncbi:TPA: conjugal transfer protein TraF [Photobacterium damselae]|uniref:conjugal transfer protein TraF n=1 Tax=Photobacterium damselae TaxID=38293 RepID=UPI001F1F0A69|nr:conjugal transfer protein TraF [Photobacterium damselae]UKA31869.1 conjugal transfer protein TraF [Photobacterium damselae subsp. damselae]